MTISLRSPFSSVLAALALAGAAAMAGCDRHDDHVYKTMAPKVSVASARPATAATAATATPAATQPAGKPITARSFQIGRAPETGAGKPTEGPAATAPAATDSAESDAAESDPAQTPSSEPEPTEP